MVLSYEFKASSAPLLRALVFMRHPVSHIVILGLMRDTELLALLVPMGFFSPWHLDDSDAKRLATQEAKCYAFLKGGCLGLPDSGR